MEKALEDGSKGKNSNLAKLEAVWDLDRLVSGYSKSIMVSQEVAPLLEKLGACFLLCLSQPVGPGPPLRRAMAKAWSALHEHSHSSAVLSLLSSLNGVLAGKDVSVPGRLGAMEVVVSLYVRNPLSLDPLLSTTIESLLGLAKASSDVRVEALNSLALLVAAVGKAGSYAYEPIWKAGLTLFSVCSILFSSPFTSAKLVSSLLFFSPLSVFEFIVALFPILRIALLKFRRRHCSALPK